MSLSYECCMYHIRVTRVGPRASCPLGQHPTLANLAPPRLDFFRQELALTLLYSKLTPGPLTSVPVLSYR